MTYVVKEIFESFQGEGAKAGTLAVFVRFAGCNLWDGITEHRGRGKGACSEWCDTDFAKGEKFGEELADAARAASSNARLCILTGGEPMLQVTPELVASLHERFEVVAIETNGTVKPRFAQGLCWVTCSPKLAPDGTLLPLVIEVADEIKVVVPGAVAGWTAEKLALLRTCLFARHYFLQPADLPRSLMGAVPVEQCLEMVHHDPTWRISLQQHKLLGLR